MWAKKNLNNVVLQGGMDPKNLLSSEEKLISSAKKYLDLFKNLPYIFNLGHGLLPETDPDKVSKLIKLFMNLFSRYFYYMFFSFRKLYE